jgi:membrane-bound ClpP family serine protease
MELDDVSRHSLREHGMHALASFGIILLALGLLAYAVFKVTVWIAIVLFVAGVLFLAWGATKVKRAI